jgi:hypothetical protein
MFLIIADPVNVVFTHSPMPGTRRFPLAERVFPETAGDNEAANQSRCLPAFFKSTKAGSQATIVCR